MKICRVEEMRELDRRAVEEFGIINELLMENAGLASYSVILNETGIENKRFVVFSGSGNNGGDGLVVARKIHSNGGKVTVFMLGDRKRFKGAAKRNLQIAEKLGLQIIDLSDAAQANESLAKADAVVDAIFGTGLDREVEGKYKEVIERINISGKTVFSIDISSGINGDSGQILGTAVKANHTTTYGQPKLGNLLYPGFELGGKLSVTHISFPPALHNGDHIKIAVNDPMPLPHRRSDSHKGDYGKVLFIAGSSNYLGAPFFSAQAFLKAGGGLAYLATTENVAPFIAQKGSEIILLPVSATPSGSLCLENKKQILDFAESVDFVVIGPGLSLEKDTRRLVVELTAELKKPILIDGDGLTAIAIKPDVLKNRKQPTILTPHPGEMSRLTGQSIEKISQSKVDILQQTAQELNASIVLKGAHSLIGLPDQSVFLNLSGNAGMATAGSGDVLAGTIAAMFGLGFTLGEAVRMGVFTHGFGGDLTAKEIGQDGIIAGDILNALPQALKLLRTEFDSIAADHYGCIKVI